MLSVICYGFAALAVIGWSPEERFNLAFITFAAAFLFQRAVVRPVTGIVYATFLFPTLYVIIEVAGYPDFDPVATPVTLLIVWAAASALVDAVQEWIVAKAKAALQAVRNAVRYVFVTVFVHLIQAVVAFLIKGVVQALALLLVVVPCAVAHGVAAIVCQVLPERVLVTIAASRPFRAVAFVISKIVAMATRNVVSFLVADARESAATLAEELPGPDWVLRAAAGAVVDDAATPEGAERAPDAPEVADQVAAPVNQNVNEGMAVAPEQANDNDNNINNNINNNSTAAAATNVVAPAAPQVEIRLRRLRAPPPPGGVDDDDDTDLLPPNPPSQAPPSQAPSPPPRGSRHVYVGPPSNGNSNRQQEAAAVAAALSEFDFHAHYVAALAASRAASAAAAASNGNRTGGDSGLDDVTALMSPEDLAVAAMSYYNGVGAASVASSSSSSSPTIPTIPTPHVQPPHVHQQQQQEARSPLSKPGCSDDHDPFHADDVDSSASLLPACGDVDSERVEATDDKAFFFCESSPRSVLPAALSNSIKKKRKIDDDGSSSSVAAAKSDAGADPEDDEINAVGPPSKKARTSDPATAIDITATKKTGRPRSSSSRAAPKRSSGNVRVSADDHMRSSNVATTKADEEETKQSPRRAIGAAATASIARLSCSASIAVPATNPCTSFSSKPAVPAPPQQLPAVPLPKKKKVDRAEIRAAAKLSYDEHVQSEPQVPPPPFKKARRTME
jgi:hypothetical protein